MTYKAAKQDDGTYTIHDVEIFEECVREYDPNSGPGIRDRDWEPPNPPLPIERHVFDAKWMREAVERFKERRAKGYLPPVHFGNHNGKVNPQAFALIENIAIVEVDGRKARLFCDIVLVPKSMFERIKAGEFPHRAVEINDPSVPEISSLALISSEPFFKFPLLTVNA